MASYRKQPLDFRKAEVSYIAQRWRAGESCALVGVSSVGKSNLLQHLSDAEVQQHYLDNYDPLTFHTIVIDPNMLGPLPREGETAEQVRCWAGYELMLHRIYLAFYPFDILGADDAQHFYDTYQALQDGTNPLYAYMGLRYFELALEYFMRREIRLVFLFDEFEEMLRQLPVKFFQTLRGIRDANKTRLSFVTFSRQPLPVLLAEMGIESVEIEPFVELFADNTYFVGPYTDGDARRMIDTLQRRNSVVYSDAAVGSLIDLTGRFAGLIRACFRVIDPNNLNLADTQLAYTLLRKSAVANECRTLWQGLSAGEHEVLRRIAGGEQPALSGETETAVTLLVQKRLLTIDRTQSRLDIVPPLFRAYVHEAAR